MTPVRFIWLFYSFSVLISEFYDFVEYRKLRHIKRHLKKSGHSGYTTQAAKTL